jgi:hypothetical protein
MKLTRCIFAVLLALLGVALLGYTPFFYHTYSAAALSFVGASLLWVFLGIMNLLLVGRRELWTYVVGLISNAAGTVLAVAMIWTVDELHSYVRVVLIGGLLIFSLEPPGKSSRHDSHAAKTDRERIST